MSVKTMLRLVAVIWGSSLMLDSLARKPGFEDLWCFNLVLGLAGFILLLCALNRENTPGNLTDRSDTVPPKAAALIFCGIGLMVGLLLLWALARHPSH
jgi:hypothetical protein